VYIPPSVTSQPCLPRQAAQAGKQHRQLTHNEPIPFADCKQRLARKKVPRPERIK